MGNHWPSCCPGYLVNLPAVQEALIAFNLGHPEHGLGQPIHSLDEAYHPTLPPELLEALSLLDNGCKKVMAQEIEDKKRKPNS